VGGGTRLFWPGRLRRGQPRGGGGRPGHIPEPPKGRWDPKGIPEAALGCVAPMSDVLERLSGRPPMLDTEPAGRGAHPEGVGRTRRQRGRSDGGDPAVGGGAAFSAFLLVRCAFHQVFTHRRSFEARQISSPCLRPPGAPAAARPYRHVGHLPIHPRATSCTRPRTARGRPGRTAAALPPSPLKRAVLSTAGLMGRYQTNLADAGLRSAARNNKATRLLTRPGRTS